MKKDTFASIRSPPTIAPMGDPGRFFGLLGRVVLCLLPVLGILGALALLALKQYQYLILSLYLVVPLVAAPVLYLLVRNRQESGTPAGDGLFKLLVAGFLVFFAFSLTLLQAFAVRPTAYYVMSRPVSFVPLMSGPRWKARVWHGS